MDVLYYRIVLTVYLSKELIKVVIVATHVEEEIIYI